MEVITTIEQAKKFKPEKGVPYEVNIQPIKIEVEVDGVKTKRLQNYLELIEYQNKALDIIDSNNE